MQHEDAISANEVSRNLGKGWGVYEAAEQGRNLGAPDEERLVKGMEGRRDLRAMRCNMQEYFSKGSGVGLGATR